MKLNKKKLGDYFQNRKKKGEPGLPVFSVTMNSGIVKRSTLDRKMKNDVSPENSLLVEPGDIVYNMMRMWQGAVGVCSQRGVVSPAYVVCRPKQNIDPFFAFYLFKSKRMLHRLASYSHGITEDRLRLYYKDFSAIPVEIPSFEEQIKISRVLSNWGTAINQTRKLIELYKKRKNGLMQQLLWGKKRVNRKFQSKDFKHYRFFDIPCEWRCPQLKSIAKESTERNKANESVVVLLCSKHRGFVDSGHYFGKKVFSDDTSNYKVLYRGSFGYPSNHIEEGSIGLLRDHEKGLVSPIYTVFKCNKDVVPEYLYAVFKSETFRHIFSVSTNSSVDRRGSLRWREFSLIRVPLPDIDEQQAIADVLQIADKEIDQLERKLKTLEKQKRSLMQKLLTGEIRVLT